MKKQNKTLKSKKQKRKMEKNPYEALIEKISESIRRDVYSSKIPIQDEGKRDERKEDKGNPAAGG